MRGGEVLSLFAAVSSVILRALRSIQVQTNHGRILFPWTLVGRIRRNELPGYRGEVPGGRHPPRPPASNLSSKAKAHRISGQHLRFDGLS